MQVDCSLDIKKTNTLHNDSMISEWNYGDKLMTNI